MERDFAQHDDFLPQESPDYSYQPESSHCGGEMHQDELAMLFHTVDRNNDGEISSSELQTALTNGFYLSFNLNLCELMISMYGSQGRETLRLEEFEALWKYVQEWSSCFRSFDEDGSGSIDLKELNTALSSFGYRFSPSISHLLMSRFDRNGTGTLHFDDFVHACIILHTVTGAFRNMDRDKDGFITINYEQFVNIVISIAVHG